MYSVTRLIHFCYGHRLLDYEGKCRHPHGHNGVLEIEIDSAALDKLGMVVDFGEIKKRVQTWVDAELDHNFLLNEKDPLVELFKKQGERFYLMKGNPTAEAIAKLVFDYAKSQKLAVKEVRLWETENSYAAYRG
jgi:6-pyruvoyltetrahydropterin/6-carboxytetrahydropterin synthase